MSKELKKAIFWGVIAETISFILMQLPLWVENGDERLIIMVLGILGGLLNLPALTIFLLMMLGTFLIVGITGIGENQPALSDQVVQFIFNVPIFVMQTMIWIRVWWNTFKRQQNKTLKLLR